MTSDAKFDERGAADEGGPEASGTDALAPDAHEPDPAGHGAISPDEGPASQRLKLLLDEVVGGLDESYHRYGSVLDDLRSRLHDLSHQTAEAGASDPMRDGAPGGGTPGAPGDADLQARFDQLTENLESTLSACAPSVLSETIAPEAADHSGDPAPDLQVLQALADRLEGMEGSLRRGEAHAARIEVIENQLMELIDLIGSPGSQIERVARQAAAETAERLRDERQASGAAERLDAIQKELCDLNQRTSRMDERTSGTLDAIGDRLQNLAKRYRAGERPSASLPPRPSGNGNGNGYYRSFRTESAGEPIIVRNGAGHENGQASNGHSESDRDDHGAFDANASRPQPYWGKSEPDLGSQPNVGVSVGLGSSPSSSTSNENEDKAEIQAAQPQPEISTDSENSELSRLEILEASLLQIFEDIPDDDDRFELILTRDKPARLRIDNHTHVAMNPDARIYRLIRSTAKGRKILAETEDVGEIGKHVTDYVFGQMAVRQRQRDGFAKHKISTPTGDPANRRSTSVLAWAFIIGLITGGCGLLLLGYLLSQ